MSLWNSNKPWSEYTAEEILEDVKRAHAAVLRNTPHEPVEIHSSNCPIFTEYKCRCATWPVSMFADPDMRIKK